MKHYQYANKSYRIVILVLWIRVALGQQNIPASPCPDMFQYRHDGTEYFGTIIMNSPEIGQTIKLNVNLSLRQRLPTTYPGALGLYTTKEQTLQNIIKNQPIIYKIRFPVQTPLPLLTQIVFNGRLICSGPPDYGPLVTTIKLEHTLHTQVSGQQLANASPTPMYQIYIPEEQPNSFEVLPQNNFGEFSPNVFIDSFKNTNHQAPGNTFHQTFNNIQNPQKPQSVQPQPQPQPQPPPPPPRKQPPPQQQNPVQQQQPTIPIESKFQRQPVSPASQQNFSPIQETNSLESINNICGKLEDRFNFKPLVVGGEQIERGTWPWLVAVFLNSPIASLSFQCGGNLISARAVVTAAHCFFLHSKRYTAKDVIVYLGRHNIRDWSEQGMIASSCDSIHLHPDYNDNLKTFDADIAVVVLKNEVKFTEYIRPVCIWSGPDDTDSIEGEHGVVVGWGRNEAGQPVTAEPRKVEATVVSDIVCLRSNDQFRVLTSNRTFCAGNLDGRGPCTGDSGGGLMIRRKNRWMLRGTVSASLADPSRNSCNLNEYVIYADVAKFLDWIQNYMFL